MDHEYKIAEIMKKYKFKKSFRKIVARNISGLFWFWYLENKKMRDYLIKQKNFSWLQLGYDELALYPKLSIKYVYEFLDVEYLDPFSSLSSTESHNIFGNSMLNQQFKRDGIFYDNRWFNSQKWILPWILFPQISFYNQQLVYGNVKTPFIS